MPKDPQEKMARKSLIGMSLEEARQINLYVDYTKQQIQDEFVKKAKILKDSGRPESEIEELKRVVKEAYDYK